MYDFDTIISRKNTQCSKFDSYKNVNAPDDVIPMWIADMDFKTLDEVNEAIKQYADHGIYGYMYPNQQYYQAVDNWFSTYFNFPIKADEIVHCPGIVFAFNIAIQAFTQENDGVLIQSPVYHPFANSIKQNKRKLITNPLINNNGKYSIDFNDFEQKIIDNQVKLFILCSPHNPVGRVWDLDELTKMGDICLKHGVIVVSDEIHCDFTYHKKHHCFASIKPEFAQNCITCFAPSKTFNIAGLQCSNIVIKNPNLHKTFCQHKGSCGYSDLNTFAVIAATAAYTHGRQWLDELLAYVEQNYLFLRQYLSENMPQIKLTELEGTYLAWLDFNGLDFAKAGINKQDLHQLLLQDAKVWLNNGNIFGSNGDGFMRMNLACPRQVLVKALQQIKQCLNSKALI